MPARIYLDACALSRLTDDQSQPRIQTEAEAVEMVFWLMGNLRVRWVASRALEVELRRNPDGERRHDALLLLSFADELVIPNAAAIERAQRLEQLGYGAFDALHLAAAEQAKAEFFLTTDDRLLRKAQSGLGAILVRVVNPVDWLREWNP